MTELHELNQRMVSVEAALVDGRVERQHLSDDVRYIKEMLKNHTEAERSQWSKLDRTIEDMGRRLGVLEAAKIYAAGAKGAVEWFLRYGWIILIGAVAAGYWWFKSNVGSFLEKLH